MCIVIFADQCIGPFSDESYAHLYARHYILAKEEYTIRRLRDPVEAVNWILTNG